MEQKETQKLSYEKLEEVARQLAEQLKNANMKLQYLYQENSIKRLEFLFKVVKYANEFNSEFVTKCIEEIEEALTVKEEQEENNKEEKN